MICARNKIVLALGVSRMSVYRYMAEFADFPSALPTFKWILQNRAAKRGIPRKADPASKARPTRPD